jgi:uroporphyrinogen decarboxylase
MKTRIQAAAKRQNTGLPPIWFMRQAGRYHSHYRNLKLKHSFLDLCRIPELATEVTFGPIESFDFDAAILFSDLLFPLEALGMDLDYAPGPKLSWHIEKEEDLARLTPKKDLAQYFSFQGEALRQIRAGLSKEKSLLGFVGGPLTLFFYAVDGSHQNSAGRAKTMLSNGIFTKFCKIMQPVLMEEIRAQARSGCDVLAVLDTCAGDVSPELYAQYVVPEIDLVFTKMKDEFPDVARLYYSKGTSFPHWDKLLKLPIDIKGIDWNTPIVDVLKRYGNQWAIQGNFDPNLMLLEGQAFEEALNTFFAPIRKADPDLLRGWICGLGHGVLQQTPEKNVLRFIERVKQEFPE